MGEGGNWPLLPWRLDGGGATNPSSEMACSLPVPLPCCLQNLISIQTGDLEFKTKNVMSLLSRRTQAVTTSNIQYSTVHTTSQCHQEIAAAMGVHRPVALASQSVPIERSSKEYTNTHSTQICEKKVGFCLCVCA